MFRKIFGANVFSDLIIVLIIMSFFYILSTIAAPNKEAEAMDIEYDKCMIENMNKYNTLDKVNYVCKQKAYGRQ